MMALAVGIVRVFSVINIVPQWKGSMARSERGKFSTSGFHLTVPVSLLPIPPVRTLILSPVS